MAEAKSAAGKLDAGEAKALELRNHDRLTYLRAIEALLPTGMALDMGAADYAEAWKALGGKASLVEAAMEFARLHLHELPNKLIPEALNEMIEAKTLEGISKAYLKVLRATWADWQGRSVWFLAGAVCDKRQCPALRAR